MSKLFLIPTPVGNLKDITFRAVEILGTADIILARRHTPCRNAAEALQY